jgi:hypothetical protein
MHFNRLMSDLQVLMFAYVFYARANPEDPYTVQRVQRDYQTWLDGGIAPDYACSELRRALQDIDHRLISVALLETYMVPVAA